MNSIRLFFLVHIIIFLGSRAIGTSSSSSLTGPSEVCPRDCVNLWCTSTARETITWYMDDEIHFTFMPCIEDGNCRRDNFIMKRLSHSMSLYSMSSYFPELNQSSFLLLSATKSFNITCNDMTKRITVLPDSMPTPMVQTCIERNDGRIEVNLEPSNSIKYYEITLFYEDNNNYITRLQHSNILLRPNKISMLPDFEIKLIGFCSGETSLMYNLSNCESAENLEAHTFSSASTTTTILTLISPLSILIFHFTTFV